MAEVKKINGYDVKDATARQQIAELLSGKIQSGRTDVLTMNSAWEGFTITMPQNMPNTDYTIIATAENNVGSGDFTTVKYSERAINSFKIWVATPNNFVSHNIFINWIAIAH